MVVDRFYKMVHFVPSFQVALRQAYGGGYVASCFHVFLTDVVSDQGPQFASQFWKVFISLLCTTVSLTSGYQPQSNGQTKRLNQELETILRCVPSAQALICHCRHIRNGACQVLLRSSARTKRAGTPYLSYRPGQNVWLTFPCELASRFVGPLNIAKVVNLAAVQLRVHSTFHVACFIL